MDETFAGIDWASEEHALCVVDEGGLKLEGEFFTHDEMGIEGLIARMRALGVARIVAVRWRHGVKILDRAVVVKSVDT